MPSAEAQDAGRPHGVPLKPKTIELEFSVLAKQRLDRRIPSQAQLEREVLVWVSERNAKRAGVSCQLTVKDARDKFQRHYPSIST